MADRTEIVVGALAAALFVILGIGMLLGGWFLHDRSVDFVDRAVAVPGTIVDFDTITTGMLQREERTSRVPVVRFRTEQGRRIELKVRTHAAWTDYQRDDAVTILYDPLNPENARIQAFYDLWFFQGLLALLGIAFIAVPPWTLWRHVRANR